ncbi:hypothetical protein GOPIP_079_00020 [Gordonia polyisoprenivorans NBRC 16320 = JCM 10675]|uniref:Uncharacterized protein n=2 Tax=Gordonia polyisoprenivorans TaxID=84595 RepID=A0A846WTD5_9ACTN|nr:hypothetical protein [Gordonia polyisoprenivorans]GAB25313.1 hypothetical protein GOPIP_079_00020 [Gordonia polyisoprenivorans NBRC 16320 = JCM 10675]
MSGSACTSELTMSEVESAVTKRTELLLRSVDVTWAGRVRYTPTAYGSVSSYVTASPEMLVAVDVIEDAGYACATFEVPDSVLAQRISKVLFDLEFDDDPTICIRTGTSHPISGHMADTLLVLFDELDRRRVLVEYDGPITDDEGRPLE